MPDELLERVQVDGERPVLAIGPTEHPVVRGQPFGELPEVVPDALGIGAEIMRSVLVDQHTDAVVEIVGVAGDVRPAVDHQAAFVQLAGQPLGQHRPREPRADDEVVIVGHDTEWGMRDEES